MTRIVEFNGGEPRLKKTYGFALCGHCGRRFEKGREWSRFCGDSCRVNSWQAKNRRVGPLPTITEVDGQAVEPFVPGTSAAVVR